MLTVRKTKYAVSHAYHVYIFIVGSFGFAIKKKGVINIRVCLIYLFKISQSGIQPKFARRRIKTRNKTKNC